jgi:peroxiredoxin
MRKATHRTFPGPALTLAVVVSFGPMLPAPSPAGDTAAPPPATPAAAADGMTTHDHAHGPSSGYDPDSGAELIGHPAPPWRFQRWVRGGPLTLDSLRGKVVLMRFWTEDCRFCAETLPAIELLRRHDADRGLVVLGVFHPPKAHQKRTDARILALADSLGFGGPIACDQDWKTLGRWWLDGHPDRNWVSVSFLVDRDGIVRWVHGGGEYHPSGDPRHQRCDVKFRELEAALEPLLEPRTTATP